MSDDRRRCASCSRLLFTRDEWYGTPASERPSRTVAGAHAGRGLCRGCATHVRRHGDLSVYPRRLRPSSETVEEWEHLRASGVSKHEAARQLGVTVKAIEKAHERVARRRNQQMQEVA